MKIREGFVSNSSSSSFVILGKTIPFDDITDENIEKVWCAGDMLAEGYDVFSFTKEMLDLMIQYPSELCLDIRFILAYKIIIDDNDEIENDLPKRFSVLSFEQDYHSTEDLEDFKRRYIDEKNY